MQQRIVDKIISQLPVVHIIPLLSGNAAAQVTAMVDDLLNMAEGIVC